MCDVHEMADAFATFNDMTGRVARTVRRAVYVIRRLLEKRVDKHVA